MLGDKRFLRTIRARNILSFGPDTRELELGSLNVLIGPNGSGKSNLTEVITLLQAAPRNLLDPILAGGGISEWLWKGHTEAHTADIDATIYYPQGTMPIRHRLALGMIAQRAEMMDEAIENERACGQRDEVRFYYRYQRGHPVLNVRTDEKTNGRVPRQLRREDLLLDQSVLSQRRDPDQYPEITYLANEYGKVRLFRDWNFGRNTPLRKPQATDLPPDFLLEDASNLALVLNDLEHRSSLRRQLVERLKDADASIEDFSTKVQGGTIQLYLHYSGLMSPVPATRLSDGTLRYLCLLAILFHPSPPPLVCLEEPELGLHPDLVAILADLLMDASQRMQLIVTTHSDTLVDGLSRAPEAVLVCEKTDASTVISRRSSEELSVWLKDYGLGQLWRRGEIGGNRW